MNKSSLPSAFPWAIGSVSVLVILGVVFSWNIWTLGLIIGISLFAYYFHVNALKTYSQNAADSIYYFGFSLTVITLATSAIYNFGAKQNIANLGLVFSQFGIGLIATCLGLILRLMVIAKLDVQNHISTVEEEETARRQLINDLSHLRLEVVGFAEQLKELNQDLHQQQKTLHSETIASLKYASQQVILDIQEVSEKAIADIAQTTVSLQQLQKTFFTESLGTLKNTIIETETNLKRLSEKNLQQISLLDFTSVTEKTNTAIAQLGQSSTRFAAQAEQAVTHLTSTSHALGQFSTSLNGYQAQISSFDSNIKLINQNMGSHANQLQNLIDKSHTSLNDLSKQHTTYTQTYQRYNEACEESIRKTVKSVETVASALTQVANDAVQKLS
jgi:hypothetical protein